MRIVRIAAGFPAALLLLALAAPAFAAAPSKPSAPRARRAAAVKPAAAAKPAPAATARAQAAGAAGMVVGVDPETGLLGPATAEQMLQLFPEEANALSRSSEGLVQRVMPGGRGVMLDLAGRFQEFSYVRMTPDGRYVFGCANDPAVVRRGLTAPAKHPAVLEDR